MPKEPAASKITDAPKVTDEELEQPKTTPEPKIVDKHAPGTVLDEDDEYETVVVKRKKAARPTGRYVAISNYRYLVPNGPHVATAKKQGAAVQHNEDGQVIVALRPGPAGYDLPEAIAEHALAAGAVIPEVR